MFATVFIPETSGGTTTDLDGAFSLELEEGSYTIEISYVGYTKLSINDVLVKAGEVTPLDIRMQTESEVLEEVVVEARQLRNTEAALATIKRKSVNVMDGISSASFKKMGDGDAAAAVKRVPGVSIEAGKYVFVRGLGDRYTKSVLNGMDIPGLDPDRNTLQMDIFPTNILDNIIVLKSFTADLPADFTGGIVNITTKDFPEDKTRSASISMGYNPDMHFNESYLNYEGGSTDFLGFDDGSRENPVGGLDDFPKYEEIIGNPNGPRGQEYQSILRNFGANLAAMRNSSFMDFGLGFSSGNQFNKEKVTLGYNFAATYKNSTRFYEGIEYSRYGKNDQSDVSDMELREFQKGDLGENNVLLGGLAGFSMKTNRSKYNINLLHLQNGESKAGIFDYRGSDQGASFQAIQHNLEYSERQLSNVLFNGIHSMSDGIWELDYKLSATRSAMNDPDIRFTRYQTDASQLRIGTESGLPTRIWRDLIEYNYSGKADMTKEYNFKGREAKLKFGGGHTYKERSYEIQDFQLFPNGIDLTGDPNELLSEDNLWDPATRQGTFFRDLFTPNNPNKFDANAHLSSAYVSTEIKPIENFKTIIGVRAENYIQRYTGINQSNQVFNNETVLDDLNLFPTLNMIYALGEKTNLRLSATRTIARPSFKEASFATIIDPLSGRTFIGGFFPDVDVSTGEVVWDGQLQSTDITNLDLRWETYGSRGQTIAVSAFYKAFTNPIEIVQYVQAPNNFQPRNVGDGRVIGAELEVRQNLSLLSGALSKFNLVTNFTFTDSEIEMSETEFRSRQDNAREGQSIDNKRDMAGQAPYLINVGVTYQDMDRAFDAGFYYNVQGRTLLFVGIADRPDVYSVPFHNLKFTANKAFGPENQYNISFEAANILGDLREEVFQSFGTGDEIFTQIAPGRIFSFSFGYKF